MVHKVKNDILLIVGILILAGIALISFYACRSNQNLKVYGYYNDTLVLEVSLEENGTYIVSGGMSTITLRIENQEVWVEESACADQVCVHQGHIKISGQTITCLPNRVYFKIVGSTGLDASI